MLLVTGSPPIEPIFSAASEISIYFVELLFLLISFISLIASVTIFLRMKNVMIVATVINRRNSFGLVSYFLSRFRPISPKITNGKAVETPIEEINFKEKTSVFFI